MQEAASHALRQEARLRALEQAIQHHKLEKVSLPDCPCWANAPQRVDADLYAAWEASPPAAELQARILVLESAIRTHREAQAVTPACTCWANSAPHADARLYAVLEGG